MEALKDFVLQSCESDINSNKINKHDIEGFLSSFNYNQYGNVAVKDVTPWVFSTP